MASKGQLIVLGTLILLAAVIPGEFSLTPSQFFASPLYWAGLLAFGVLGAFGIGNKSQRVQKYRSMGFGFVLVALAFASRKSPDALTFAFGFPGGFIGIGLRILYWFSVRQRWLYCPTCQAKGWAFKKEGGWVCDKGHNLGIGKQ